MIPKEKAATIVVDEIILAFDAFMDALKNFRHELEIEAERYWIAVKSEIEKNEVYYKLKQIC